MIPDHIVDYLKAKGVPFVRYWHPRVVAAQQVAHAIHVSGHRVAKVVVVDADGRRWLAVLPASLQLDDGALAKELGARHVRLVPEAEFVAQFKGCERGAEPPFGRLYDLPVVVERSLTEEKRVVFRAGSHEETLELAFAAFMAMEEPRIASFGWR